MNTLMRSARVALLLPFCAAYFTYASSGSLFRNRITADENPTGEGLLDNAGFFETQQDIANSLRSINRKVEDSNQEIMSHAEDINGVYDQLPTGKNMRGWRRVSKRSFRMSRQEVNALKDHMHYCNRIVNEARNVATPGQIPYPPLRQPSSEVYNGMKDITMAIQGADEGIAYAATGIDNTASAMESQSLVASRRAAPLLFRARNVLSKRLEGAKLGMIQTTDDITTTEEELKSETGDIRNNLVDGRNFHSSNLI